MARALEIRLKKGRDGPSSFVMVRPDGSITRQHDRTGGFFPPHDLTHYAVERELGYRRGFYGIVADGWDLVDFGHPWPKGPLPPDTDPAESIVGILDLERSAGTIWTAHQVNEAVRAKVPGFRDLTEDDLGRIRKSRGELLARWRDLPAGETLVLSFPLE